MSTCTRITVILAASLCAHAPPASCDTISDTADRRILGGHTFVPSGYLRDPFIMTSVTNLLAVDQCDGGRTIPALFGLEGRRNNDFLLDDRHIGVGRGL